MEYLERTNLFIVPLDSERHWYRYHHLFGDLLRQRLGQRLSPGEIAEYHFRASMWFEKDGDEAEAFHHAFVAGCAFVGGSRDLSRVLTQLADLVERRIVVNAVLISTLQDAVETLQHLGIFREALQVQVARTSPLAGGYRFCAEDLVYVIVGGKS